MLKTLQLLLLRDLVTESNRLLERGNQWFLSFRNNSQYSCHLLLMPLRVPQDFLCKDKSCVSTSLSCPSLELPQSLPLQNPLVWTHTGNSFDGSMHAWCHFRPPQLMHTTVCTSADMSVGKQLRPPKLVLNLDVAPTLITGLHLHTYLQLTPQPCNYMLFTPSVTRLHYFTHACGQPLQPHENMQGDQLEGEDPSPVIDPNYITCQLLAPVAMHLHTTNLNSHHQLPLLCMHQRLTTHQ